MFFVILMACDRKEIKYIYFANGELEEKIEMKDGLPNGERVTYYEDGSYMHSHWENGQFHGISKVYYPNKQLKSISEFSKGKLNGQHIIYFDDGKIAQTSTYRDDIRVGSQHQYFKNGRLWRVIDFINHHGKEMETGYVEYGEQGNVVYQTARILFHTKEDTLEINKKAQLKIELINPPFKSSRLIIGNYDSEFHLKDCLSLDTITTENNFFGIWLDPRELGENYVRGRIENYKILNQKGDTTETLAQHIYFEFKYFVKNRK